MQIDTLLKGRPLSLGDHPWKISWEPDTCDHRFRFISPAAEFLTGMLICVMMKPHEPQSVYLKNPMQSGAQPRVRLVSETALRRESLQRALSAEAPDFIIQASSKQDILSDRSPDVIIFDLAGRTVSINPSLSLAQVLHKNNGSVPVILIAEADSRHEILQALRGGLRGYLPTSFGVSMAVAAIRLVLAGGTFLPPTLVDVFDHGNAHLGSSLAPSNAREDLTPRENQVLALVRRGKPNKLIAFDLGISEGTVKVHLRSIMRKLGAHNRTEAALLGRPSSAEPNMLSPEPVQPFELFESFDEKSRQAPGPRGLQIDHHGDEISAGVGSLTRRVPAGLRSSTLRSPGYVPRR